MIVTAGKRRHGLGRRLLDHALNHLREQGLDEVELAIEDAIAERASLSRWCLLFAHSLDRLEERARERERDFRARDLAEQDALWEEVKSRETSSGALHPRKEPR